MADGDLGVSMNIYVWIALIAVLMKAYIGIVSRKYEWADPAWFFLVSAFLMQNLTEMIGYHQVSLDVGPEYLLKVYYITLMFLSVAILRFVCSDRSVFQQRLSNIFMLVGIGVAYLVLFTPLLLNGHVQNAFPVQAVKGEYFHAYLALVLICTLLSFSFIAFNYINSESHKEKRTHLYHLASLSPILILGGYVAVRIFMGFSTNGSGVFPIAGTIFMMITLQLRCRPGYLIDSAIPFTKEHLLSKQVGQSALAGFHQSKSLKQISEDTEFLILQYAIERIGKNKTRLSSNFQIDRKTLDRKLKKHELWWKG
jgi:hypothetical protein